MPISGGAIGGAISFAGSQGLFNPLDKQATKKARTIYIGNVGPGLGEGLLRLYFEQQLPLVPGRPASRGSPVENIAVNPAKMYAFVEFTTTTDADISLCMDGAMLGNSQLRIRRPKNYEPPPGHDESNKMRWRIPGVLATHVEDGPNKIFLGSIPLHMADSEIQAVVQPFGNLNAFTLVRDLETGQSKGYAFFSFENPADTDRAVAGLDGFELGGKPLSCKLSRAATSSGSTFASSGMSAGILGGGPMGGGPGPLAGGPGEAPLSLNDATNLRLNHAAQARMQMRFNTVTAKERELSRILVLHNMVTVDELQNPTEYEEIKQEIQDECAQHGPLSRIIIPKPGSYQGPDLGKVFLEYRLEASADAAFKAINGRRFAGRTIAIDFVKEQEWLAKLPRLRV